MEEGHGKGDHPLCSHLVDLSWKCTQNFLPTVVLTRWGLFSGAVKEFLGLLESYSLTMIIRLDADHILHDSIKGWYMVTHSRELFFFLQTNLVSTENRVQESICFFIQPIILLREQLLMIHQQCINVIRAEIELGSENFFSFEIHSNVLHVSIFQDILSNVHET